MNELAVADDTADDRLVNGNASSATRTGLRLLVAATFVGALLCTLVLSATPQLHERLHKISSSATHECAVTLLSAGGCDHAVHRLPSCDKPAAADAPSPLVPQLAVIAVSLSFARLEHAPPAQS